MPNYITNEINKNIVTGKHFGHKLLCDEKIEIIQITCQHCNSKMNFIWCITDPFTCPYCKQQNICPKKLLNINERNIHGN